METKNIFFHTNFIAQNICWGENPLLFFDLFIFSTLAFIYIFAMQREDWKGVPAGVGGVAD